MASTISPLDADSTNQLLTQIASAVSIALSASATTAAASRHEAHLFLTQVKEAHQQTWQSCLQLFLGDGPSGRYSNEARLFAIQVVGDSLRSLSVEAIAFVESHLFHYFHQEYVQGNAENKVVFIKNASLRTMILLFNEIYPSTCPLFLSTFISLTRSYPQNTPFTVSSTSTASSSSVAPRRPLNPKTTDLLVRLLHEAATEISDAQLRLNKSTVKLAKDAELRDAIRERDAASIANVIWEIVGEALDGLTLSYEDEASTVVRVGLKGDEARELAEMSIRVIGDYVSWIDINLMVTPLSIPLLLRALHLPSSHRRLKSSTSPTATISASASPADLPTCSFIPIRIAAADALVDTVNKGMPSTDKLALLTILDLGNVLAALVEEVMPVRNGVRSADQGEEMRMLVEKLGKMLGAVGVELCKIVEDDQALPQTKSSSQQMITSLLPLLLRFLSSSDDETSLAVQPFATSLLSAYKKEKKRSLSASNIPASASSLASASTSTGSTADREGMTQEKRDFLVELLKVIFRRMEYCDAGHEWIMSPEGEEEEEEIAFAAMRKSLTILIDSISSIDPLLYSDAVRSVVLETLDTYEASLASPSSGSAVDGGAVSGQQGAKVEWQRLELALVLIHGYSGPVPIGSGPALFVQVPLEETARSKRDPLHHIPFTSFPLSLLGEIMLRICRARLVDYDHPAVALGVFEVVVRFHDFFRLCPEFLGGLLPSFLDEHGLHQSDPVVQARVCYLFNRFIYSAKGILQAQISGEVISNILARMQDLLVITATLPPTEQLSNDFLVKAASLPSPFTSQLHLFETVGTLISILNQVPSQQVVLLRAALSPLLNNLQSSMRTSARSAEDFAAIFQAHHLILAVGNVGKGFPDLSARVPVPQGDWVLVFKEATEAILEVAKRMSSFVVIREAARFAFNRIVSTTGEVVLPLIPTLIDCLIGDVTFAELGDLLNFLGLLSAKYKTAFLPILNTLLLPVFKRVFHFLELPITGTDDTVQHSTLRRAYFTFILSMIAAGLSEVLYSEKNKSSFQDILQSIPHYISHDALATDQKFGFLVLSKLCSIWVVNVNPSSSSTSSLPTASSSVPSTLVSPISPTPATTAATATLASTLNGMNIEVLVSPVPGFEQFLYNSAVKLCFEIPLERSFDYGDASSFQVIGEISNFLKLLLIKRGAEFSQFMTTSLLPSIQCPPEAAESFVSALQQAADGKQFKKFACEWLKSSRGPVSS